MANTFDTVAPALNSQQNAETSGPKSLHDEIEGGLGKKQHRHTRMLVSFLRNTIAHMQREQLKVVTRYHGIL